MFKRTIAISMDNEFEGVAADYITVSIDKDAMTFIRKSLKFLAALSASTTSKASDIEEALDDELDDHGKMIKVPSKEFSASGVELVVNSHSIYWRGLIRHGGSWESDRIHVKEISENWNVSRASRTELPLLIGTLTHRSSIRMLKERLKKK